MFFFLEKKKLASGTVGKNAKKMEAAGGKCAENYHVGIPVIAGDLPTLSIANVHTSALAAAMKAKQRIRPRCRMMFLIYVEDAKHKHTFSDMTGHAQL